MHFSVLGFPRRMLKSKLFKSVKSNNQAMKLIYHYIIRSMIIILSFIFSLYIQNKIEVFILFVTLYLNAKMTI